MTPWVVLEKDITAEELDLLEKVKMLLENFPDMKFTENGREYFLSCHLMARAIAAIFNLEVKDGHFGLRRQEHSWLLTKNGNILDVYPVGQAGGPMILLGKGFCSPWPKLYREDALRLFWDDVIFQKHLGYVLKAMQKNAEILKISKAAS